MEGGVGRGPGIQAIKGAFKKGARNLLMENPKRRVGYYAQAAEPGNPFCAASGMEGETPTWRGSLAELTKSHDSPVSPGWGMKRLRGFRRMLPRPVGRPRTPMVGHEKRWRTRPLGGEVYRDPVPPMGLKVPRGAPGEGSNRSKVRAPPGGEGRVGRRPSTTTVVRKRKVAGPRHPVRGEPVGGGQRGQRHAPRGLGGGIPPR